MGSISIRKRKAGSSSYLKGLQVGHVRRVIG